MQGMSNRRKTRDRPAPSRVVLRLLDGRLVERDLDRYPEGAWLCMECGEADTGSGPGCGHEVGYHVARVRAAAALNPPGAVLRA